MSEINKKKFNPVRLAQIIISILLGFALLLYFLIQGKNIAILNPKGLIAQEQLNLLIYTVGVILFVLIPTIIILFIFAWRYRENAHRDIRMPKAKQSKFLVPIIWAIPSLVVVVLAGVMWSSTHRLAPQKSIAAGVEPITIQVVALSWKWLFIYPEQKIATVNFVQIPINTPVKFELTADETPMSSFWIPNLGGQLYAMTGHVNQLNLMAETVGDYPGSSAEINGRGFAGMRFTARASSSQSFDQWVEVVRQSPEILDIEEYQMLLEPSEDNPAAFYSAYENNLYSSAVMKYLKHSDEEGQH
jgi:cytochrome o ubiquinol oxidase subunit 2